MTKLRQWDNRLYPLATLVLGLAIWQAIVAIGDVPGYILPSPADIAQALAEDFPLLFSHAITTLYESFIGFACSIALAFALSIVMDSFQWVKKSLYPLLIISQTVPTIAIAPLLIIWFGFGAMPKILMVILTCFFPIVISLTDGFDKIDRDYTNYFHTIKASKLQTLYHLKLPSAMVNLFSGLKIGATYMLMAAVIGEWLGGDKGLGVYMVRTKNAYALDKVFASIVIIIVISLLIIKAIDWTGKKLIHWK